MFSLSLTFLFRLRVTVSRFSLSHGSHGAHLLKRCTCVCVERMFVCVCVCVSGHVCHESHDVCECVTPVLFLSVCMEQCENAASLLASVREQEMQFERLTRALEEERRSVGPSGTLPRPLPTLQVTPSQPITQQQGSPHHRPCCITLHQCVLVGTLRSMAINPSFTIVQCHQNPFFASFPLFIIQHLPFVIITRSRLHHSAVYGVWHHRILLSHTSIACFLMSPICLPPHNLS